MQPKTRSQIALTLALAGVVTFGATRYPPQSWFVFLLFLVAILISSSFKVALPRGDGSMSLNFPFILLGITQLSPLQVILLTAISVAVQCRIRVMRIFTAVQIAFNVANAAISSICAYAVYMSLQQHGMALGPRLALASVAYFLWNTISVAGVIASTKNETPLTVWRREFSWYLPFYIVGGVLAAMASWMSVRFGWTTALLLIPMVYTIYRAYQGQMSRLEERQRYLEETEALQLRTIEGLAMAIEAKDQGTHDHLFRVRSYVSEVGLALKLSDLEMRALQTAAFLHDIGKLAVPEHIINKPGKLSPQEFEKMKIHPIVGADILERVRFPYPVVPMVRAHHEWWDGSGYPDGLAGEAIPIGARILTVVDCFDALVSDRPYRKSLGEEKAFAIIRSMAGKQFDPTVVVVFERLYEKMKNEAEAMVPSTFVPLNTEVEVSRGAAPGAGFETHSERPAPELSEANTTNVTSIDTARKIAAANHEAQTLYEMALALSASLTGPEALSMLMLRISSLVPFEYSVLFEKNGDFIRAAHHFGEDENYFADVLIPLGEGISGWSAQSGKAILNGNATVEPSDKPHPFRAALSIPLFNPNSESFGALTLYSRKPESFQRDHLRVLQTLEAKLSMSVQHIVQMHQAKENGQLSKTKGLPDARELFTTLDQALSALANSGREVSVLVCNIDGLRQLSKDYSPVIADSFVSELASLFQHGCKEAGTVARVGSDEFVFIFLDTDESQIQPRIEAILSAVGLAAERSDIRGKVTASTGASFFPCDGLNAEDLLAVANRRMFLNRQTYRLASEGPEGERSAGALALCRI